MKKKAIVVGIGIVVGILAIVFTNIDELTVPKIEESISKIEFDTRTVSSVTGLYAINTKCEYALLFGEIGISPIQQHTEWFEQKFGDIKKKVTEAYYDDMAADGVVTPQEMERLDALTEEFYEKVKLRINPSLLQSTTSPGFYQVFLDEDPECAKIVQEYYPDLIQP